MERPGRYLSGGRLWRPPAEYTGVYEPPAPKHDTDGLTDRIERWARRLLGL